MKKLMLMMMLSVLALPYLLSGQPAARTGQAASGGSPPSIDAPGEPASPIYTIPFAGTGNRLELTLANTTGRTLSGIAVRLEGPPEWVVPESGPAGLAELAPGEEATVALGFGLAEQAPSGDTLAVRITASDGEGFAWSKSLRLKVGAPARFELLPNYPNPFNPATTIAYRLPAPMRVRVAVYNLLGRRVATLAEGPRPAGQHTVRWHAGGMASGLYFYRVVAEGADGKRIIRNRKMLLVK